MNQEKCKKSVEIIQMHMSIEGGAIAEFARRMYYKGETNEGGKHHAPSKRKQRANYILNSLRPNPTPEQKEKILSGDAQIVGDSTKGIGILEEPDWRFKAQLAEWKLQDVKDKLEEQGTREIYMPTEEEIEKDKQRKRKNREREEFQKELKKSLKSEAEGEVKLDKWIVQLSSLEEYAKAISWLEKATIIGMTREDPMIGANALQNRINKHKQIFKEAKVKYHGDLKSDRRKHPEPSQLYNLVEDWITKNHPELDKSARLERAKDEAFALGTVGKIMDDDN